MKAQDTIYACATAKGKAGIAIMRLSGPKSWDIVRNITGVLPKPRQLALRWVKKPDGEILDQAMVAVFEKAKSFTGEKSAELHLHGSQAVINAVISMLSDFSGVRLAEPGEFSRWALENGKMNLAEIEGLSDLIRAETEAQRRQSMRLMRGEMAQKVAHWRDILLKARALIEAVIDFSEEEIPKGLLDEAQNLITELLHDLRKESEGSHWAERLRTGFEVAIIGPPNVGKSTIINRIAGRDLAITSKIPGTTRDIIELCTDIDGVPVTFLDTAGLHESTDCIEKIGIERTRIRAKKADLRIILTDGRDIDGIERQKGDLVYAAKADLGWETDLPKISGKTEEGIPEFLKKIGGIMAERVSLIGVATNARHRQALNEAILAAEEAQRNLFNTQEAPEIAAENLRKATKDLNSLIGMVDVEEVLGQIFSQFCVGK